MPYTDAADLFTDQRFRVGCFRKQSHIFTAFKQKLYKEFQCSFPGYCPLFQDVNIRKFRWQVRWLWEFLVNTHIDQNTCEWLKILIDT